MAEATAKVPFLEVNAINPKPIAATMSSPNAMIKNCSPVLGF